MQDAARVTQTFPLARRRFSFELPICDFVTCEEQVYTLRDRSLIEEVFSYSPPPERAIGLLV